ncbi:unnamed protein product [Spirodela intermedia]|uniref:BZIP domain-containing protein n=1 Tax=Spirodela intermedia TaxID=51605 RepID=A0A7I8JMT6_SPIIN|nr:unnamed protein product [Spirodela intermedia]CAA6671464.1 unnamed protein product [Spirodela intermedia]
MASSSGSGTSSGSTLLASSDEDLQLQATDMRKQKRKLSNRESARRSRQRKQKHLDDLTAQVGQLRKENGQIITNLKAVTQQCLAVETENSVLRAQMTELGGRLHSLGEILQYVDQGGGSSAKTPSS